ncbi:MHYT domain-containing protein [Nocardiopsis suaedae]|uniref:Histidine kinase n=1 Tax=Nocardiopsis suaedae TaxID=3018444 RepID=A0ABT4TF63_9ACTN|nr:MHYT domain-containing protein [Nocardiopsis suaedae]MDA2803343.1 histidine kinase [Nocardiopsis suaedae]
MVEHFAQGAWTPLVACAVSVLGSFLGLRYASRALSSSGRTRAAWTVLGGVSLGGAAVWSMHFIAMLGFRVPGTPIRYDPLMTAASAAVPVIVMTGALAVVIARLWRRLVLLPSAGALVALAMLTMHYMGMGSMRMDAEMVHHPLFVAAAALVALAASVGALWFVGKRWTLSATLVGAALLGAAVTAMHYIAMAGVGVESVGEGGGVPGGVPALGFLTPMVIGPGAFLVLGTLVLLALPDERPVTGGAAAAR